jgi:hypothetical protein
MAIQHSRSSDSARTPSPLSKSTSTWRATRRCPGISGLAFSVAATTLVGQALGAGDPDDAERHGWRGTGLAALWMAVMGDGFVVLPDQTMSETVSASGSP